MTSQERMMEAAKLRLRLQMNGRLRLELLAALSKVFREYQEPVRDELLSSLVFAVPEELMGEAQGTPRNAVETKQFAPYAAKRESNSAQPPLGSPPVGEPPLGSPPVGEPPLGTPPVGEPPLGTPVAARSTELPGVRNASTTKNRSPKRRK